MRFFVMPGMWVLSCLFAARVFGQDPIFSQFYAAPIHMNAAFAGLSDAPRIGMVYRNQWPLVQETFRTYSTLHLSYDQHFDRIKSGFGIDFTADDSGTGFIRSYKIAGMYSYKIELNRDNHYLKGGIEVGMVGMTYGWDKFIFGDQIDPKFGYTTPGGIPIPSREGRPLDDRVSYIDLGAGMLYHSPVFFIGLSAKHINTPSIGILNVNNSGFDGLPLRWSVQTGGNIDLMKRARGAGLSLQPGLALVSQSQFFQLNLGTQVQFSTVFAGLWYRQATNNPDALISVLGFRLGDYKLAYSFDFTVSSLTLGMGGSHEFSFLYHPFAGKRKSKNINNCFEAFN